MKKQLLTGAFLLASFLAANAQVLQSDDFNSFTVGNLGTVTTGATAGQGGWFTVIPSGGSNSDFQIVNEDATFGKVLQITGANVASATGANANYRLAARLGLDDAWDARTSTNNFFTLKFDFKALTAVGSTSIHRVVLGNAAGNKTLGGFEYDAASGELVGLVSGVNASNQAGLYGIQLGEETEEGPQALIISPEEWVNLSFSYDPATGAVVFYSEGRFNVGVTSGYIANEKPSEVDLLVIAGPLNSVASSSRFDNIVATAAATNTLSTPAAIVASKFSVFPNPSNGVVTVANANALINAISVTDINGRTVKNVKVGGVASTEVNISDLASGVYMMSISSDKGTSTQKIVKN